MAHSSRGWGGRNPATHTRSSVSLQCPTDSCCGSSTIIRLNPRSPETLATRASHSSVGLATAMPDVRYHLLSPTPWPHVARDRWPPSKEMDAAQQAIRRPGPVQIAALVDVRWVRCPTGYWCDGCVLSCVADPRRAAVSEVGNPRAAQGPAGHGKARPGRWRR